MVRPPLKPPNTFHSGTWKDSICPYCGKRLNHLDRPEQDAHEEECKKQKKLF